MANLKPFFNAGVIEAGCDEAGRGCLAGPVYAAAVILPKDFYISSISSRSILPGFIRNLSFNLFSNNQTLFSL